MKSSNAVSSTFTHCYSRNYLSKTLMAINNLNAERIIQIYEEYLEAIVFLLLHTYLMQKQIYKYTMFFLLMFIPMVFMWWYLFRSLMTFCIWRYLEGLNWFGIIPVGWWIFKSYYPLCITKGLSTAKSLNDSNKDGLRWLVLLMDLLHTHRAKPWDNSVPEDPSGLGSTRMLFAMFDLYGTPTIQKASCSA